MTNHKQALPRTGDKDGQGRIYDNFASFALLWAVVLTCFAAGTSQVCAQDVKTKVIYFLPGIKDHPAGPGRHEVVKDMLVLQDCISNATNIKGVKIVTKFIPQRSALDVEDIKDADALIVECSALDSSQTRTHPLFPPLPRGTREYDQATLDYLAQLDTLHSNGMGIMILHWGIAVDSNRYPTVRDYYLKWFGQTAKPGFTQNPLGNWVVTPVESGKNHPIMRGVGAWMYKDEIFSRLPVIPDDPNRTDLLTGESPETNQSEEGSPKGVISPRLIASAYEKGKARGILWGGMDYHSAFLNTNYLRFVMNAIVWTAGIDVPEGGVKTSATQLQLAPLGRGFANQKKPEGFVDAKLPDGYVIPGMAPTTNAPSAPATTNAPSTPAAP